MRTNPPHFWGIFIAHSLVLFEMSEGQRILVTKRRILTKVYVVCDASNSMTAIRWFTYVYLKFKQMSFQFIGTGLNNLKRQNAHNKLDIEGIFAESLDSEGEYEPLKTQVHSHLQNLGILLIYLLYWVNINVLCCNILNCVHTFVVGRCIKFLVLHTALYAPDAIFSWNLKT